MTDRLDIRIKEWARTALPSTELEAVQRVRRATDNQGNVVLGRRTFIELEDTDTGTVYRLRVKSGVLALSEAPPE